MNVHATSVRLAKAASSFGGAPEAAVLLLGDAGSGKSDVALRLIAMGAELIADDRTLLSVQEGRLIARAPQTIHGLLEARGVGILRLVPAPPSPVALAVRFTDDVPRLPEAAFFRAEGLDGAPAVPLLLLSAFEASTPAKIAAAAAAAKTLFSAPG